MHWLCRMARLSIIFVGGWSLVPVASVVAHPQLMTSVRHRTAIEVSRQNIDVFVELTVGEIPAFAERLVLDNNQDGQIAASEVADYFNEQSEALRQAVNLSIAGQRVELLFLYEPEVDWGAEGRSLASQLVFRLFYFARLPQRLQAGDEIVLEDRLWAHAPSLASYHATGQDGVELVAETTASTLASTPGDKQPLVMRVRCLAAAAATGDPDETSDWEWGDRMESTAATDSIVEGRFPVTDTESVPQADRGDSEMERPLEEPLAARPLVGCLLSLGAAVLIAGVAAVLTRRTNRSTEET